MVSGLTKGLKIMSEKSAEKIKTSNKKKTGKNSSGSNMRGASGMSINPMLYTSEFKAIYDRIDPEVRALDD